MKKSYPSYIDFINKYLGRHGYRSTPQDQAEVLALIDSMVGAHRNAAYRSEEQEIAEAAIRRLRQGMPMYADAIDRRLAYLGYKTVHQQEVEKVKDNFRRYFSHPRFEDAVLLENTINRIRNMYKLGSIYDEALKAVIAEMGG